MRNCNCDGCITSLRTLRAIQIDLITLSVSKIPKTKYPNYFAYFLMHALHISFNTMPTVVVLAFHIYIFCHFFAFRVLWHIFRTLSLPEFDFNCLCRQARESERERERQMVTIDMPLLPSTMPCVRHSFTCIPNIHSLSTCFKPNLIRNNACNLRLRLETTMTINP